MLGIAYYFLASVVKITTKPEINQTKKTAFRNVHGFTPLLQDTDNNQTFPAVTVVFRLPRGK
jgi:hypothetical protein